MTETLSPYRRVTPSPDGGTVGSGGSVYEDMSELQRRGSETPRPNPTTEHVVIHEAIALIMELRDEVAKLRRTVAAQDLPAGGGITDDLLCRFRAMLDRAYPRRGQDESVESWRERVWEFWRGTDRFSLTLQEYENKASQDHEAAEDEFDQTIRQGGVLRPEEREVHPHAARTMLNRGEKP